MKDEVFEKKGKTASEIIAESSHAYLTRKSNYCQNDANNTTAMFYPDASGLGIKIVCSQDLGGILSLEELEEMAVEIKRLVDFRKAQEEKDQEKKAHEEKAKLVHEHEIDLIYKAHNMKKPDRLQSDILRSAHSRGLISDILADLTNKLIAQGQIAELEIERNASGEESLSIKYNPVKKTPEGTEAKPTKALTDFLKQIEEESPKQITPDLPSGGSMSASNINMAGYDYPAFNSSIEDFVIKNPSWQDDTFIPDSVLHSKREEMFHLINGLHLDGHIKKKRFKKLKKKIYAGKVKTIDYSFSRENGSQLAITYTKEVETWG